jgi:hypothetical protein
VIDPTRRWTVHHEDLHTIARTLLAGVTSWPPDFGLTSEAAPPHGGASAQARG